MRQRPRAALRPPARPPAVGAGSGGPAWRREPGRARGQRPAPGCPEWPLPASRFLGRRAKGKAAGRTRPVRWPARPPPPGRLRTLACAPALGAQGTCGVQGARGPGRESAQVPQDKGASGRRGPALDTLESFPGPARADGGSPTRLVGLLVALWGLRRASALWQADATSFRQARDAEVIKAETPSALGGPGTDRRSGYRGDSGGARSVQRICDPFLRLPFLPGGRDSSWRGFLNLQNRPLASESGRTLKTLHSLHQ